MATPSLSIANCITRSSRWSDAFRHIAGIEIPEILPIMASDPTTRYRNKLEYHLLQPPLVAGP
jgi:tRNA/tmRNA/rRNA uracil-C5-methylase (TrmA/RlmC/RlmD family)